MKYERELTEETLKDFEERQKVLAKIVEDSLVDKAKHIELNKVSSEAQKAAEEIIAKAQSDIQNSRMAITAAQNAINLAEQEALGIEEDIKTHEYNCKYNALLNEQTGFWDAAAARLKKLQDDLREDLPDFADFIDPVEAMENLQEAVERNPFTRFRVAVDGVITNYEQLIADLARDKLRGTQIRLSRHQDRNTVLDRFLKADDVEPYWNRL